MSYSIFGTLYGSDSFNLPIQGPKGDGFRIDSNGNYKKKIRNLQIYRNQVKIMMLLIKSFLIRYQE